ncbi:MAG: FG-GAP-like repeat-containing protein, partial [Vicinamibacterales bacterium]
TDLASRAVAADFDGDGHLDFAIRSISCVCVYPGRGDFTFGPGVELPSQEGLALVATDVNNDGRMDLAASTSGNAVDVFVNQGAFLFTAASVPVALGMEDIAATDLNGDGRQDLIVTVSTFEHESRGPGTFHVLLGNGNGTFQSSVAHATGARGALAVTIGDFNHDGKPDVATGNRSTLNLNDVECAGFVYWDSVTIAPGIGNGSFGEPATFRLGTRNALDDSYQNMINALSAADLNGDGWTDLIASPGAILLSRAPVANRSPIAGAGVDQTSESENGGLTRFDAAATDGDNDWLDFEWRDPSGAVAGPSFDDVPGIPVFCEQDSPGTYTLTVTDRHGGQSTDSFTVFPRRTDEEGGIQVEPPRIDETIGTDTPFTIRWFSNVPGVASYRVQASADDGRTWATISGCGSLPATAMQCMWNTPGPVTDNARVQVDAFDGGGARLGFDASERFRIIPGPTTALPFGWYNADVGAVGAPGSGTYNGTTFTVKGSGSDIWGVADEFHVAYTAMRGDFDVVARVKTIQDVSQWTKAGLMLREQLHPGARHASVFVTPTTVKGIAFQRRTTMSGESVSTAGPAITAPVWLRLSRSGDQVTAFYRTGATGAWSTIGTETLASLPMDVQVGLAVSSHRHSTLATATFDNVQLIPPDTHLPPGWSEEDIGAVGAAGNAEATVSTATVTGSGADIWGTADEFHWAFRSATGDFSIETLVDSVENVNRWTKAGLMIRADSGAGSQHASLFATPTTEKGVAFQGRPTANGVSMQAGSSKFAAAPTVWLRLTRTGNDIRAYVRKAKTDPWVNLALIALPGLPATVKVGVAVSSHVDGTLATASFSQLTIEPVLTWTTAQIGPGSSSGFVDGTFFSALNRGADIWGASDAFTYLYTQWTGDGAMTVRINQMDPADRWTKAGVMFRASLAAGAPHAFVLASAEKGLAVQYRASANGPSASGGSNLGMNAPGEFGPGFWLQIVREGDTFTGYVSTDTTTWNQIGQAVVVMGPSVYVGIAVTSHNVAAEARGLFDDVTVRRGAFSPTPTPPFPE